MSYILIMHIYTAIFVVSLFFNPTWAAFQQLHEILDPLLNAQGQKPESGINLKSVENKIGAKKFGEIINYFQLINQILNKIESADFFYLPSRIFQELERLRIEIAQFATKIRTIRTAYKINTAFERELDELNRLHMAVIETINLLFMLWMNHKRDEMQTELFKPELPSNLSYLPSIWFDVLMIKEPPLSVFQRPEEWWLTIDEWKLLNDTYQDISKHNKTNRVFIKELYEAPQLKNHEILKDDHIRKEFLYFFGKLQLLIEHESPSLKDKQKKKDIQFKISQFIDQLLTNVLIELSEKYQLESKKADSPLRILPNILVDNVHRIQENLVTHFEGDLSKANQESQKALEPVSKFIDDVEEWFNSIRPLILSWDKVVERIQKAITHGRSDLIRMAEEFETYAKTVKEESFRSELTLIIDEKIHQLEVILQQYERETNQIIAHNFPELQQIEKLLQKYESEVLIIKDNMKAKFQEFKEKDVDLYSNIKIWTEKYESLKNRIRFTLTNLLFIFFQKFQKVLAEEEELFQKLGALQSQTLGANIGSNLIAEFTPPDRMNSVELKERIDNINEKLLEIDATRQHLEQEKAKCQQVLGKYLKENQSIETKKCVICHKLVTVTEDHFIQCQFCKSLSHYSCAAWWIDKYNSCPVCHNVYMVPNSTIYDPTSLEEDEDSDFNSKSEPKR